MREGPPTIMAASRATENNAMNTVRLTGRETDVLSLIARGCTYAQVADRLGISAHTVATHIKNLYRKLEVRSAGAAVMRGVELQQITGSWDGRSEPERLR
jgi:DNA-binding CsgD family transcriptional regulator